MIEEKKEPEGKDYLGPALSVGALCVVIVIMGIIAWSAYDEFNDSTEIHLRHEITQMDNVSDDYIQGWLDCVDEYHKWIRRGQNVTSQIANNTL